MRERPVMLLLSPLVLLLVLPAHQLEMAMRWWKEAETSILILIQALMWRLQLVSRLVRSLLPLLPMVLPPASVGAVPVPGVRQLVAVRLVCLVGHLLLPVTAMRCQMLLPVAMMIQVVQRVPQ